MLGFANILTKLKQKIARPTFNVILIDELGQPFGVAEQLNFEDTQLYQDTTSHGALSGILAVKYSQFELVGAYVLEDHLTDNRIYFSKGMIMLSIDGDTARLYYGRMTWDIIKYKTYSNETIVKSFLLKGVLNKLHSVKEELLFDENEYRRSLAKLCYSEEYVMNGSFLHYESLALTQPFYEIETLSLRKK